MDGVTRGPSPATLSGLLLAQFLVGTTGTLVVAALPSVRGSLGMTLIESTWLVTVTILANSATTSLWAKLGDRVARRRVLQSALSVFVVGTLGAGLAPTTEWLFAARAAQGIGIGGITVLASAVVAQLVAPRARARVNAWLVNTQMAAMFLGPLLGGALSQSPLGWRSAFLLQLPVAAVAMLLIHRALRGLPPVTGAPRGRLNFAATVAVPAGVAAALLALSLWSEGAEPWLVGVLLAAAAVVLAVAVVTELRSADPLIPVRLLGGRTVRNAVLASFAVGLSLFSSSVYASQYAQTVGGFTPLAAGLLLTPTAAGMAVAAFLAARHLDRTGRVRGIVTVGLVLLTAGYAALAGIAWVPVPALLVGMVLVGAGTATVIPNLILMVHNTVPQRLTSSAGGLVIFAQTLGGAAGIALSSVLVTEIAGVDDAAQAIPALYAGYAALAVVALVLVLRIRILPLRDTIELLEPLPG